MSSIWKDGIYGFIVGDALGIPVEFSSGEERKLDPVVGMREYGTYNQPKGTWSNDSSMTLATIDSIKHCKGIDYDDLMARFYKAKNTLLSVLIISKQQQVFNLQVAEKFTHQ